MNNSFSSEEILKEFTSGDRPWLNWAKELPSCDIRTVETGTYKTYDFFHDDKRLALMHQEIRDIFLNKFDSIVSKEEQKNACILLKGGTSNSFHLYDSDTTTTEFRQEAYFRYLFICNIPNCYGLIDLNNRDVILFVPKITEQSERWNGERLPMSYYSNKYGLNKTYETIELDNILQERNITTIYILGILLGAR